MNSDARKTYLTPPLGSASVPGVGDPTKVSRGPRTHRPVCVSSHALSAQRGVSRTPGTCRGRVPPGGPASSLPRPPLFSAAGPSLGPAALLPDPSGPSSLLPSHGPSPVHASVAVTRLGYPVDSCVGVPKTPPRILDSLERTQRRSHSWLWYSRGPQSKPSAGRRRRDDLPRGQGRPPGALSQRTRAGRPCFR